VNDGEPWQTRMHLAKRGHEAFDQFAFVIERMRVETLQDRLKQAKKHQSVLRANGHGIAIRRVAR
jgi:hypothetical protein